MVQWDTKRAKWPEWWQCATYSNDFLFSFNPHIDLMKQVLLSPPTRDEQTEKGDLPQFQSVNQSSWISELMLWPSESARYDLCHFNKRAIKITTYKSLKWVPGIGKYTSPMLWFLAWLLLFPSRTVCSGRPCPGPPWGPGLYTFLMVPVSPRFSVPGSPPLWRSFWLPWSELTKSVRK